MPIYEYCCPQCGLKFELLRQQSQSNDAVSCTRCGNSAGRIFSSFASFSKSSDGSSVPISGSASCGTCSAASCDTCHA
ncbi:MAG: FmdB family zinc ribbon protein [Dehalococcoidia bacterium]